MNSLDCHGFILQEFPRDSEDRFYYDKVNEEPKNQDNQIKAADQRCGHEGVNYYQVTQRRLHLNLGQTLRDVTK